MSEDSTIMISDAPRFCPDCGREADSEGRPLCSHCGGPLAIQGYCPICESRVRRRVGEPCPKHDVELLSENPFSGPPSSASSHVSWVTVARFPDSLAASAARIRLDAEGIPTFIEGERMGAPAMYRVATGGVKLQVPAELVADARVILSQDWSWPDEEFEKEDGLDLDDVEPATAESASPRAFLIELLVILGLAIPLIAALVVYLRGE